MKIVEVVPYFFPAWSYGGPAKLVYDMSLFLSQHGNDVEVITSDCYDSESRMPAKKRIPDSKKLKIHYFANLSNRLAYRYNLHFAPGLFFASIPLIRKSQIVHLHDFYTIHHAWIVFLCTLFRKPYILSVHGCLEKVRQREKSVLKQIFLQLFGYAMLSNASVVIATSVSEKKSYKNVGIRKERIVEFGHGVDPNEFTSTLAISKAREVFGIPKGAVVFTYLGRLHKIKGIDLLVHAFAKLTLKDIYLIIAGSDDGYLQHIQYLIHENKLEKRVEILGAQFGKRKADLFRATDVFVYPSRSEGFSLGILEAASVGLPLLLSEGCHFEIAGEKGAALVVSTAVDSLVSGMRKLYGSSEMRKRIGQNAKRLINSSFSLEIVGKKYEFLYKKIISNYD